MAGRLTTMACFAILSLVLGGLVCAPTGAASIAPPSRSGVSVDLETTRPSPGPIAATKKVTAPVDSSMTSQVPVGCDRLVSVLARSAASRQIGRCLT